MENKLIVIAEDSPTQSVQLQHFLENNSFRVMVGENGKIALNIVKQKRPDIIISDIVMPEMDGYQFCSILKNNHEFASIPFILLTNLDSPGDVQKGLFSGADDFLPKPFNQEQLLKHIFRLLDPTYENNSLSMVEENISREKILNFMISTYENLLIKTRELEKMKNDLAILNLRLEHKVIERTHELEELNKDLESYSHSMSHDLKAPLRAINGYTTLLIENIAPNKGSDEALALESIQRNIQKVNQFIEDMLRYSQAGRRQLELKTFNLAHLVDFTFKELTEESGLSSVKLLLNGDNTEIRADRFLIKVVLQNLLSNALKFTSKSSVPLIEVTIEDKSAEVVISVKDNGVGFDPQQADKLFVAFKRLHSQSMFDGTGVGLAICARIIKKHNGRIWAESKINEGATFYFTLPILK